MARINDIITPIELHSVQEIKKCFFGGVSPNALHNNEPLIYELISEYTRSEKFKDCVRAFIDSGLEFADKTLLAVLANELYITLGKELTGDFRQHHPGAIFFTGGRVQKF